jgi:acyl-homoserine lactone acylase PvdQ
MRPLRQLLLSLILLTLTARLYAADIILYRDRYGVPSIEAANLADAVYGLGYAMAQDNAEQMARNFKQARGRLAEVDGKGQLTIDGFIRALGIEEMAQRKAQTLSGATRDLLQSFCDGANRALIEQKGHLPDWVEPFTPTDVLAMAQLINAAFPLSEIAGELMPSSGSNQFAVSAKRSATGHAILSADPHLLWSGIFAWYEFALYTKEFHFRGVTLAGLPFGSMGHTDKVAWCMTNNSPRLYDFFLVKTNPNNAKQYSYHGQWRDFEDVMLELRYREDGQLKTQTQRVRRTAWGPMAPLRPFAVRLSMLDSWAQLEQTLQMARAQDAKQLRDALRPQGLSMWNIVYADTKGSIGYQYNARVPRRDESFDWTKPVPGDDPKTQWGPLWTQDELPHVENPKSGLLVNCNTAPWLTPLGNEIPEGKWPHYVTSYGHTTRYDRLSTLLEKDDHITVEAAKRYATDTLVPYGLNTVRALYRTAMQAKTNGLDDPDVKAALDVLNAWDGRADLNTKGCGLYLYWFRGGNKESVALAEKAGRGEAWSETEAASALALLKMAAQEMRQQHGRLDVPWGELHVSQRGDKTAPVTGFAYIFGYGWDKTATVTPNFGSFKDGRIVCSGGSSFRMIVHLDPKGVQSWSLLPYGDSQNPQSPHYADQMALFGRGEYKDTYFGLARTRKNAASQQTLAR